MLISVLLVWWVSACHRDAETSSGGPQLPDKLHQATLLLTPHYDISPLSYAVVDVDIPLMAIERSGLVYISDSFLARAPVEEVACTIIHELWHYHNYDAPIDTRELSAQTAGRECVGLLA